MNLDRTFCASPQCKGGCGRALSPPDRMYAKEINRPLSFAYFCGEPEQAKQGEVSNV